MKRILIEEIISLWKSYENNVKDDARELITEKEIDNEPEYITKKLTFSQFIAWLEVYIIGMN